MGLTSAPETTESMLFDVTVERDDDDIVIAATNPVFGNRMVLRLTEEQALGLGQSLLSKATAKPYEPCAWCASRAFGLPCPTHGPDYQQGAA